MSTNHHADSCSEDFTEAVDSQSAERLYSRPSSFTDLLPWVEYLPDSRSFLLDDGASVGAFLELIPVGSEARSAEFLEQLRDGLQVALTDALPEDDRSPWILQVYVQDEPGLLDLRTRLRNYGTSAARESEYYQIFGKAVDEHLARLGQPSGLFHDTQVTGTRWKGQVRRVRVVLYRRVAPLERKHSLNEFEKELNECVARFVSALESVGISTSRGEGADFYRWMLPWFNPRSGVCKGTGDLFQVSPYPGDQSLPFGYDFAECLTLSPPRSERGPGCWFFDNLPHTIVSVLGLRRIPDVGVLSAEKSTGDLDFALMDRLPPHTVFAMTVIVKPQDEVRNHIARIKRSAVGDSADAVLVKEDAQAAEKAVVRGDKLFPVNLAFYVRAETLEEIKTHVNQISALLLSSGLQPILWESDQVTLDSYLLNLPMVFEPKVKRAKHRTRLMFSKHIANLLPVYGRSRGTNNPGIVFFNRGAEPIEFDPLNAADRSKNAHALILGPTGAGKSAMLVYLLQQLVARHRPRVFIIEAGGSFSLLGQHFAKCGLTVNQVTLKAGVDVSLPPFSGAIALARDKDQSPDSLGTADGELSERDRLGEMEIAARIMITGGEAREVERMNRADRMMIRTAILQAAQSVSESGRRDVLVDDVAHALRVQSQQDGSPDSRKLRAHEVADSMSLFCSGIAGHFFNRAGTPWPEVDVTILEMGLLAREGYEDQLTLAYLSLMNHINDLVERHQNDERPTLVVTDEGHIITTHPLLANYVIKITKMWRKLGAWFWIATQSLSDFPDASRKMLNMMEWWLCLTTPKEEVDHIERFRELSSAQRRLLLSTRKEPGKYVEGVLLSNKLEVLFRNVPPPISLTLAMTEKQEKAERYAVMQELGCDELAAAEYVARRLVTDRQSNLK